jgi:very-short-patch-repair endonuclease
MPTQNKAKGTLTMPSKNIVIGQKVNPQKVQSAWELRRLMTPEEKILWRALRANRLDRLHFRRQQVIDGFIVDFYCHAAGLYIELDGEIHDEQVDYDQDRDRALSLRDLRVLRFKNEQIREHLDEVLSMISAACRES